MSEPVRSIIFFADENGISPPEPQFAGVQGEHNATEVKFQLSSALTSPEYLYRIEFSDAAGEYDSTDFIPISGSFVNYLLPENWTKAGGVGVIHLCAVVLGANGQEEQEVYSLAGRLKFAPRESGGMKTKYEKGLSALISEAGKATDAANEAAESANAAADRVDESVSSANTAAANANRAAASADASAATAMSAAGTATTAAGAANTAASQAQAAKAAADTAASGADASAEQARTAAANANTAAGTANTAASNANAIAQTVQAKLDAGELKGEKGDKGDTGPKGPQGVSGVYVGSGEMPEGYTVQVDPTGDMLCYTAGESDDRYANVLTGTASGPVAALEDVSPTGALRRAAVLGATAETGSGDKGPDNPYTLAGVQPTKVTVCGKNLLPVTRTAEGTYSGVTITPLEGGLLKLSGTCTYNNTCPVFGTQPVRLDGTLTATVTVQSGTAEFVGYNLVQYNGDIQGLTLVNMKTKEHHFQRTCMASGFNIRMDAGTVFNDYVFGIQLEKGDTATPYEPYTGQTITLPALAPLYGDGTVNDEYDAVSGVETRRWGILTPDGTGATYNANNGDAYFSLPVSPPSVAGSTFGQSDKGIATHFPFTMTPKNTARAYISNFGARLLVFFGPEHADIDTVEKLKTWLSTQAAAGTPFTVVYPLGTPVVTQHDPARILPPTPVCRIFADAGNTAVGYNRDVNIVIPKLEAALAELLGGGAQPME